MTTHGQQHAAQQVHESRAQIPEDQALITVITNASLNILFYNNSIVSGTLDLKQNIPVPHPLNPMVFLFESLPFELTFRILFQHGGFDSLETVLGRHACWELLKLMNNSPRAKLLCICRAVQLLDHPAHALFLLNYPPDSSIPENRRAWDTAIKCCIGWEPDVRSVVLAMRAFIPPNHTQVFPWLNTALLTTQRRSAEEWKHIGQQQRLGYKFNEWWWNCQREAFQLERAGSDMGVVIANTARAETGRLFNALRRRELEAALRLQKREVLKRMKRDEDERRLKEGVKPPSSSDQIKEGKTGVKPPSSSDRIKCTLPPAKKKAAEQSAKDKERAHHAILDTTQRACSIPSSQFASKLDKIARLIVSIEKTNPLIKWNLRLLFHTAAQRAGMTVWDMEFFIHGLKWEAVEEGAVGQLEGVGQRSRKC